MQLCFVKPSAPDSALVKPMDSECYCCYTDAGSANIDFFMAFPANPRNFPVSSLLLASINPTHVGMNQVVSAIEHIPMKINLTHVGMNRSETRASTGCSSLTPRTWG